LILGKIIDIVATRCHISRLKCTELHFACSSAPYPTGGDYSATPNPLTVFKWLTVKGRDGRQRIGREGRGM